MADLIAVIAWRFFEDGPAIAARLTWKSSSTPIVHSSLELPDRPSFRIVSLRITKLTAVKTTAIPNAVSKISGFTSGTCFPSFGIGPTTAAAGARAAPNTRHLTDCCKKPREKQLGLVTKRT